MKLDNAKIVGVDVPSSQYRREEYKRGNARFTMSRGELMTFLKNPHKWKLGAEDEDTKSTIWGNLMDTLTLTRHRLVEQYVVAPEKYPSKGMECPQCKSVTDSKSCRACKCERVEVITQKDWDWNATYCDDWRNQHQGKEVIKADLMKSATVAECGILTNRTATGLLECSERQVMVVAEYKDAATGLTVPLKCLLDIVPSKDSPKWGKTLGDFKTALSCNPPQFEKAIFDCNYDAQAALYHDMYVAATGEDRTDWVFIVQENQSPYEVADPLPTLSTSFMDIGRAKYQFALKFYARCLAINYWPSYSIGQRSEMDGRYMCEPSDWMVMRASDWPKLPEIEKPTEQPSEEYCIH